MRHVPTSRQLLRPLARKAGGDSRACLSALVEDHSITWRALAWRAFGMVSAAIGVINAFLPLLPTTVFLLIALWAFGKGAPEWRQYLLAHPRWGEPLRHWEQGRCVSLRAKRMASLGMAAGWLLCALSLGPTAAVLAVGLGLASLALWLWMRPERGS